MTTRVYDGFTVVKHDLLGFKDAANLHVAGRLDAANHVLLCAGFPCDHSSFIPLARHLVDHGDCLVGVACLPDYDRDQPLRPEGWDLHEMGTCFSQAVAALQGQASTRPGVGKLTLIVHDWGIVPGFMHSNSVGCDKLVVFDVLPLVRLLG